MARVDLPQSKLRRRRRRRRAIAIVLLVAILLVLLAGGAWLAQAKSVRISRIEVMGAQTVSTSTIEDYIKGELTGRYLFIFPRDNIFIYPRQTLSAGLMRRFPGISQADVHAADFHTVEVDIIERQPAALWCPESGEGCSYMDENGIIYAAAPQFSEPVYVAYRGEATSTDNPMLRQYLKPGQFQSLFAFVAALASKEPDDAAHDISVDGQGDVRINFESGFRLVFALSQDTGDVFERFSLALESDPFKGKPLSAFEYLDLRFGDKLYYKAK